MREMKPMSDKMREALRRSLEVYHPCTCGVHVCGIDENDGFITVANIIAGSPTEARAIFEACKAEAVKSTDEPTDYVVDLNLSMDDRHVEDFSMTRQMLDRCVAAGLAKRAALATLRRGKRTMDKLIEQSERYDSERGMVTVETLERPDGSTYTRELYYTCSICGAKSDTPFPRSAISCFRKECLD